MNSDKNNIDEKKEQKSIWQMDVKDLFKSDALKKDISPKGAIISICILCLIGLYGYFIVYPKFNEYNVALNNLESAQSELLKYQQKLEEMPILEKRFGELQKEANVKSRELSHDMEDGLFLIGLDNKMRSLGIKLKNYNIEDSIPYDNFYAIPMTLNIEGDYRRVRDLIYFLEEQENITQVMDYSMNTKMTEIKKEISKRVYWTRGDSNYHLDKTCPDMVEGDILFGIPAQSGGRKPDSECVGDIANTIDVEITSTANGDVTASIRFIVYSSDNDIMKLETDKPENWKPGKYNPFQDTLN
ncbi:MAG: type 4a pilus biogenesis protein PilO [Romboutsia sp.]|uniref:type 4a pilus biogenesis protein PilO n=1 Tax=Romboutsia sp. TaxID=1965302 RepID=UPI003F3AB9EB